jgi:hypothetical protein
VAKFVVAVACLVALRGLNLASTTKQPITSALKLSKYQISAAKAHGLKLSALKALALMAQAAAWLLSSPAAPA